MAHKCKIVAVEAGGLTLFPGVKCNTLRLRLTTRIATGSVGKVPCLLCKQTFNVAELGSYEGKASGGRVDSCYIGYAYLVALMHFVATPSSESYLAKFL